MFYRVSNGGTTEVVTQTFSFNTPSGSDRSRTTVDCTKVGYQLLGASFLNVNVYTSNSNGTGFLSIESWNGNTCTILCACNGGTCRVSDGALIAYYLSE